MAGWFGPQSGDCSCCGDCGLCGLKGPFTQCRYIFEISGATNQDLSFTASVGDDEYQDVTWSGLGSINGTYVFDVDIVDGCPVATGKDLAVKSVSFSWTTKSCDTGESFFNGTGGCNVTVRAVFGFETQIPDLYLIEEDCPGSNISGKWRLSPLVGDPEGYWHWTETDDCDKHPSGTETMDGYAWVVGDGLSNPCVADGPTQLDAFSVKFTADWQ